MEVGEEPLQLVFRNRVLVRLVCSEQPVDCLPQLLLSREVLLLIEQHQDSFKVLDESAHTSQQPLLHNALVDWPPAVVVEVCCAFMRS